MRTLNAFRWRAKHIHKELPRISVRAAHALGGARPCEMPLNVRHAPRPKTLSGAGAVDRRASLVQELQRSREREWRCLEVDGPPIRPRYRVTILVCWKSRRQ